MIRPSRDQVRRAERNLRAAGHRDVEVDGELTKAEQKTLATVQRARGLEPTGKLDARTRGALGYLAHHARDSFDQTLGQKSKAILQAERRLKALGLSTGKVDGILDRRTGQALADFKADQFDLGKGRTLNVETQRALALARGGRDVGAAQASLEAEAMLLGDVAGRDDAADTDITRDGANVNDFDDTNPGSDRRTAAAKLLARNSALERRTLAALSPADQAAYRATRSRLSAADDAVAALALQKLLFDGKFSGPLGAQLGAVASGAAPLSPNLDGRVFLADLVQECATPQAICQGPVGSCGSTSVAMDLALNDPAEYARLAIGVASPGGRVAMRGGMELERPAGTDTDDGSYRSSVQRMLGSAMYEISNGDARYSGPSDANGSPAQPMALLRSQLSGKQASYVFPQLDAQKRAALGAIGDSLAHGSRPIVALKYHEQGHYLLVTGRGTDANGPYVSLLNPWGREERMREDDFVSRMLELQYDPGAVSAQTVEAMAGVAQASGSV